MTRIPIHLKIIERPIKLSLEDHIETIINFYSEYKITIEILSIEDLNLPLLSDIDVANCKKEEEITPDQVELFDNRNNANEDEIVVYFTRSTIPPSNGCSTFPNGKPSTVISKNSGKWTLAHEIGHILGLEHTLRTEQLMFGLGTDNIRLNPPKFSESEIVKINTSKFVHQ